MYLYIILGVLLIALGVVVTVPIRVIADYADGSCRLKIKIFGITVDAERLGRHFTKKRKKNRRYTSMIRVTPKSKTEGKGETPTYT